LGVGSGPEELYGFTSLNARQQRQNQAVLSVVAPSPTSDWFPFCIPFHCTQKKLLLREVQAETTNI